MQVFLHQLAETHGSQTMPPGVNRVLTLKACRTAVMFGDILDDATCRQLLQNLKQTQLPFMCAHGRPTIKVFADLDVLEKLWQ